MTRKSPKQYTRGDVLSAAHGLAVSHFQNYADSYANSKKNRTRPGSIGKTGSADAHLDPKTRDDLRRQCQALLRNNPVARAIVQRIADLTVCDGFGIRAKTANDEENRKAERKFLRWCERYADCRRTRPFWQLLHEIIRAMCSDGDMLVVKVGGDQNDPPCLQLIESERVASGGTAARVISGPGVIGSASSGEYEYDGVVTNEVGRPLRFKIRSWTRQGTSSVEDKPINADECIWLVNPRSQAVNLTRGEPALQSCLDDLERLTQIMDSAAVAYHVATLLSLVVTTDDPMEMQSALATQAEQETGIQRQTGQPETNLEAGKIAYLSKGSTATQVKPEHPSTNHREFVNLQIQVIAADFGLPLILTHLDFSQVNFHSGKSAMSMAGLGVSVWQTWLIERVVRPAWEMWVEWAVATGEIADLEGWEDVEIIPPPIPSIDFEKEVDGLVKAINANLITQTAAIQRLTGGDLDSTYRQRAVEKGKEGVLGIAPALAPGTQTTAAPTSEQPEQPTGETP